MLFSSKQKGFFFEQDEYAVRMAVASSMQAPLTIEQVKECPDGSAETVKSAVRELIGKTSSPLVSAKCGIYPTQRVIRRATIDLKRLKEPTYFNEILTTLFRLEPDKHTFAVLNALDGADYDMANATQKEAIFCGGLTEDFQTAQDKLLEAGIFPLRLELGSVAVLGAVLNYLAVKQIKSPTLLLEIGYDNTQSFILGPNGVEVARTIPYGIHSMIPAVQKQLGLKDEESARKLFFSNAFDFTGMGGKLASQLLKELHSSIGFFEVQTGQSISQVLCPSLPNNLAWLRSNLANALGFNQLGLDIVPWLESHEVKAAEPIIDTIRDPRWLGLFSLMLNFDAVPAQKPS